MAKAKTYETFNGLLIYRSADGETVGIVGDLDKELLKSPNKKATLKYFNEQVAIYEERAKVEAA